MNYLLNAFSANMLPPGAWTVTFLPIKPEHAAERLRAGFMSAIGHQDVAVLLTALLGVPVEANRATITLRPGDVCVLAQYLGPRLVEGATTLPAGATITFYEVTLTKMAEASQRG